MNPDFFRFNKLFQYFFSNRVTLLIKTSGNLINRTQIYNLWRHAPCKIFLYFFRNDFLIEMHKNMEQAIWLIALFFTLHDYSKLIANSDNCCVHLKKPGFANWLCNNSTFDLFSMLFCFINDLSIFCTDILVYLLSLRRIYSVCGILVHDLSHDGAWGQNNRK